MVADWQPMLQAVKAAIGALEAAPASFRRDLLVEAIAFLRWLERDNFTFLGVREFELTGDAETGDLVPWKAAASACCATRPCRCCVAAPSWWR